MKNKLKYVIIAAVGFIGLGVGLVGIGRIIGNGGHGMFGFKKQGMISTVTVSGNIDIDEFKELTVDNSSVDFIIEPGNGYGLYYYVYEGKEPIVKNDNGKLSIEEPKVKMSMNLGVSHERICYKLTVPKGSSFDADVETSSGGIDIASCKISGSVTSSSGGISIDDVAGSELKITATSGSVKLHEAEYSGNVSVKASSGSIYVENVKCAKLDTVSTSGSCNAERCETEKYKHESSSGSFKASGIENTDMDVTTTSGEINISDAKTGEMKAQSSSGSIKIDLGRVDSVECEATSGSITIKLPGQKDDYSYNIHTNSGSIRVGDEKCEKLYENERSGKPVKATASSGGIKVEF